MTPFPQLYLVRFILILTLEVKAIFGFCNNYYQSSGPSATKRPFDTCYYSEIDEDTLQASYRYYCIESTYDEYGNNSVGGFTAFREDFDSIDCEGEATQVRIVSEPYLIKCELDSLSQQCDVLRYRQYPITNFTKCEYNASIYVEKIAVIESCDDNEDTSESNDYDTYNNDDASESLACSNNNFATNLYYGSSCAADQLFQVSVQYSGCQGDGETYLEILQCDDETTEDSKSSVGDDCGNYWQSNDDGASSSRRPFDICYRSYRASVDGDYSYRYICNDTFVNENVTVNGYTVYKQFFGNVGCMGEPNATLLEDTHPHFISCGGEDCGVVRYRLYDTNGECDDIDAIKESNDYEERVHVIEICDDDGFVSDAYFCGDDNFYIDSYNNDKCDNDGLYASHFYYEGCNNNDEYMEIIECQASTTTTTTTTLPTTSMTMISSSDSPDLPNETSESTILTVMCSFSFSVLFTVICVFR